MAFFNRSSPPKKAKHGKTEVENLIEALGSGDWEVRQEAVVTLSQMGKPAIVSLLKALNHENPMIQTGAAELLGTYGKAALPTLLRLLATDKERVQDGAARAIGQNGRDALMPLREAIQDKNFRSRRGAALALGYIGYIGPEPVALLGHALSDRHREVRKQAALSLDNMQWSSRNTSEKALYLIAKEDWNETVRLGKMAVPPLITVLEDDDYHIRVAAVRALGKIRDGRSAEALLNMLKDSESSVRQVTVETLGEIRDPATQPGLVRALTDDALSVRVEAAWSLDKTGWTPPTQSEEVLYRIAKEDWNGLIRMGGAAVPILIMMLTDTHQSVRVKVTGVLRHMGEAGRQGLAEAASGDNPEIRKAATEAIVLIRKKNAISGPPKKKSSTSASVVRPATGNRAVSGEERQFCVHLCSQGVSEERASRLAHALTEDNEMIRAAAVDTLKQLGEPATGCLVALLGDHSNLVRIATVEALGATGAREALPYILRLVSDSNENLRTAIAQALGGIKDSKSVPALIDLLDDKSMAVSDAASDGLVNIGPEAQPLLIQALDNSRVRLRCRSAEALGKLSNPSTIGSLIRLLNDREAEARKSAVLALREMSDTAFNPLIDALNAIMLRGNALERLGVLEVAAGIDDERAREIIRAAVSDSNQQIRMKAATLSGKKTKITVPERPCQEGIPALIKAIQSKDSHIQLDAAARLQEMGDPAVPYLIDAMRSADEISMSIIGEILGGMGDRAIEALIDALKGGEATVKLAAAQNLGKIADHRATAALCESLYDEPEAGVRIIASESLGYMGDPGVVDALIHALEDEDTQVRAAAVRSLGYLGDQRAAGPLSGVFQNEDYFLCDAACEALKTLGPEAVVVLASCLPDGDSAYRGRVAEALDKLNWVPETETEIIRYLMAKGQWHEIEAIGESAVPILNSALDDEDVNVRMGAVTAIARIGGETGAAALRRALLDPQVMIRKRAENALQRMKTGQKT